MPRPFKLPIAVPIVFFVVVVGLLVVPAIEKVEEMRVHVLVVLGDIAVHTSFIAWQNKPLAFNRFAG